MRIVKKFKAGEASHLVRDLQDFEKDCLLAVFVEDNADDQEVEKALSLLEFFRDRESWIECDCLASKQPLLTVALSSRGRPHLRHITSRENHHGQYRFKEAHWQYNPANSELSAFSKKRPLKLHRRAGLDDSKIQRSDSTSATKSNHYPRLARILYSWIVEAGLNYLPASDEETLADRFKLLKKVVSEYQFEEGVWAASLFFTYPDIELMAARIKEKEKLWPKDARPYAVCVSIADEVVGNLIKFSFKEKSNRGARDHSRLSLTFD